MKKSFALILLSLTLVSCFKEDTGCGPVRVFEEQALVHYTQPVDLGLSVQWAACNLGANRPEEFGGYYQWAGKTEVLTEKEYGWGSCPCHTGDDPNTGWTKYFSDSKPVLDPEDDAASYHLHKSWRMPTDAEWQELRERCKWEWVKVNDVPGYRVTSRQRGYEGKFIFLPAAGYFTDYSDVFALHHEGESGLYWSSSLNKETPGSANCTYINSSKITNNVSYRYDGLSVRPVLGDSVHVESVSLSNLTIDVFLGNQIQLAYTVTPSNATDKSVSWSSGNTDVATVDKYGKVKAVGLGSTTITVTTKDGQKKASCALMVSFGYVDLGLSVKWATRNIGAASIQTVGDCFQWGGTQPVTSTSINLVWDYCPYHVGSDHLKGWTKYVQDGNYSYWSGAGAIDNKTVLDKEDDAAYVTLGGEWHMPTFHEWMELREKCTWEWTRVNNVDGYRITSNVPGYTDKSIFLPETDGYRYQRGKESTFYSYYWSSSLYLEENKNYWASVMWFNDNGTSSKLSACARYLGLPIRPVYGEVSMVNATGVTLDHSSVNLVDGKTMQLVATVQPSNATINTVTWSSSSSSVATVGNDGLVTAVSPGVTTITATTVDGGKTATCKVTVTPSTAPPGAVSLGLSVFWATCNVGASKPEEFGGYYQWAGINEIPNDGSYIDWNICPYHTGTSSSTGWSKYISQDNESLWSGSGSADNKSVLDSEDDAATVKLGAGWRMPTREEWKELIDNCSWTWTSDYNGTGVPGMIVAGKKEGYKNNSIFLPAAGYRDRYGVDSAGSAGDYWSSSIHTTPTYASYADFNQSHFYNSSSQRFRGLSIRPVTE